MNLLAVHDDPAGLAAASVREIPTFLAFPRPPAKFCDFFSDQFFDVQYREILNLIAQFVSDEVPEIFRTHGLCLTIFVACSFLHLEPLLLENVVFGPFRAGVPLFQTLTISGTFSIILIIVQRIHQFGIESILIFPNKNETR